MSQIYGCIIVGGGPGGLTAGMYAMRAALKTVCIEKGLHGGPRRRSFRRNEEGERRLPCNRR
jgi:thioredoxin reductase